MGANRVLTLVLAGGALLAQQPVSAPTPTSGLIGDPSKGKQIFEGKGTCTGCHRINGNGSHFGPDLSEIGARRPDQLETSILDPDAEIAANNRIYRVVSKSGATTIGRLLNQDTFTVQMIDKNERLLSFQKSDLREYAFETKSPMPSFKDKLSAQELADVVAYLETFKPPPGAGGRGGRGGAGGGAPAGAAPVGGATPGGRGPVPQ
jgi:putative heme-binding domain-containing protein